MINVKFQEDKWARAPPIQQFTRQHFAEFFPKLFYDLRVQDHIRKFFYAFIFGVKPLFLAKMYLKLLIGTLNLPLK